MADVDSGEDPWRRHLHAAVDYILDGPGSGDMDEWATQVLASLGHFIRASWLALDYEAGRIRAGMLIGAAGYFRLAGMLTRCGKARRSAWSKPLPTRGASTGMKTQR